MDLLKCILALFFTDCVSSSQHEEEKLEAEFENCDKMGNCKSKHTLELNPLLKLNSLKLGLLL